MSRPSGIPRPALALAAAVALFAAGCDKKPSDPTAPAVPAADGKPGGPGKGAAPGAPAEKAAGPGAYADLGEEVLAADSAPSDAPLRPPAGATIYKLSNVKLGAFGPG